MDISKLTLSVVAETNPEDTLSIVASAITENDIDILTSPFTPTFNVLFTVTVTDTETSEVLDTKTFEYTTDMKKGTTTKSDEKLIAEWTTKISKYNI